MTGMKPWERDIIEYRPNIGLETYIRSIVKTREEDEEDDGIYGSVFTPSPIVSRAASLLGSDVVDKMLASLSKANTLLNEVESKLVHDSSYQSYIKALKEDDPITAEQIYLDHLDDIDGEKAFDVYPLLSDMADEMEVFLDYVNDELFDGKVDYSDTEPTRIQEEGNVQSLLDIESEDLRPTTLDDLSEKQLELIQKIVDDEGSDIESIDDYLTYLQEQLEREGSPRINYEEESARVQVIAALDEKANMFRDSLGLMDDYVHTKWSDLLYDDLEGALKYIVDSDVSIADMKESYEMSFKRHVKRTKQSYINTKRVAGRDVREFLDNQLSRVRNKTRSLVRRLRGFSNDIESKSNGEQEMIVALQDGIEEANATWKYILVEHMGTSNMNQDQYEKFMDGLNAKNRFQSYYQYNDLVEREFDWANKDKEMKTFISTHNVQNR